MPDERIRLVWVSGTALLRPTPRTVPGARRGFGRGMQGNRWCSIWNHRPRCLIMKVTTPVRPAVSWG